MADWVDLELELWNGLGRVEDSGSSGGGKERRCGGKVRMEAAVCLWYGSRRVHSTLIEEARQGERLELCTACLFASLYQGESTRGPGFRVGACRGNGWMQG